MLASTDLSVDKSQKAKPKKVALRDSNPQTKASAAKQARVFEASQKARTWDSTQEFSNLFMRGSPSVAATPGGDGSSGVQQGAGGSGGNLPTWYVFHFLCLQC